MTLVASSHVHGIRRGVRWGWIHRTRDPDWWRRGLLLLGENLARVEVHQHRAVRLEFLDGDGEAEIIEEEELQLQMIELEQREASDLSTI